MQLAPHDLPRSAGRAGATLSPSRSRSLPSPQWLTLSPLPPSPGDDPAPPQPQDPSKFVLKSGLVDFYELLGVRARRGTKGEGRGPAGAARGPLVTAGALGRIAPPPHHPHTPTPCPTLLPANPPLKVDDDASFDEVKRAYRAATKECHPDFLGDAGHNICVLLNEAYEVGPWGGGRFPGGCVSCCTQCLDGLGPTRRARQQRCRTLGPLGPTTVTRDSTSMTCGRGSKGTDGPPVTQHHTIPPSKLRTPLPLGPERPRRPRVLQRPARVGPGGRGRRIHGGAPQVGGVGSGACVCVRWRACVYACAWGGEQGRTSSCTCF